MCNWVGLNTNRRANWWQQWVDGDEPFDELQQPIKNNNATNPSSSQFSNLNGNFQSLRVAPRENGYADGSDMRRNEQSRLRNAFVDQSSTRAMDNTSTRAMKDTSINTRGITSRNVPDQVQIIVDNLSDASASSMRRMSQTIMKRSDESPTLARDNLTLRLQTDSNQPIVQIQNPTRQIIQVEPVVVQRGLAVIDTNTQPPRQGRFLQTPPQARVPSNTNTTNTSNTSAAITSSTQSDDLRIPKEDIITVNRDRYINLGVVGKGGFGIVFKVMRMRDRKIFAIKQLITETARNHERVKRMFEEEVTALQLVKDAPFIIQTIDYSHCARAPTAGQDGFCELYIVFQFAEISLFDFIFNRTELEEKFQPASFELDYVPSVMALDMTLLKYIWSGILKCLATLHQRGLVHRDVKLDNFVLCNGVITLIDLGLTGKLQKISGSEPVLVSNYSVGTRGYTAPEILVSTRLAEYTAAVDIWSAGVILYYVVMNELPVDPSNNNWVSTWDPQNLFQSVTLSNAALQDCIVQCLQRSPSNRPSALELLQHPFLMDSPSDILRALPNI